MSQFWGLKCSRDAASHQAAAARAEAGGTIGAGLLNTD